MASLPNSRLVVVDGETECIFSKRQGKHTLSGDIDILNHSAANTVGSGSIFSWVTISSSELIRSEQSKRPFSEDSSCNVALKRARQVNQMSQLDSYAEIDFTSNYLEGAPSSVVGDEVDKKVVDVSEDLTENTPSSNLSLPACNTTEKSAGYETPIRLSIFPGYFEVGHGTARFNQPEECFSPDSEFSPKHIPIGLNHQADVPLWRSHGCKNSVRESVDYVSFPSSVTCSTSGGCPTMIDEDDSDRWIGTCVMSMPDSDSLSSKVIHENNKPECSCNDEGSIRCGRRHVMEAREKLKKSLGQEKFIELGFHDIGEVVARKWSEEEKQLFHKVVTSKPASLGKNFWDYLPQAFPARSREEFVSYYFNVFILRKRAEQNRADPLNVDSDDDEWQESVDCDFTTTQDEGSGVESPAYRHDITGDNDSHAEADILEEFEDTYDTVANEDDEELHGISERRISDKSQFIPKVQLVDNNSQDDGEDQDVQDDSCTSYEGQLDRVRSCGFADFVETQDGLVEHGEYINIYLPGISDHGFIGSCDPKPWEISYICCTTKDDLLPTCNVIEEFRKESWEK